MMSEDERLRETLEAELEDSYQEYLTYALKGETQDLMETSPEFKKNMKKLCEDAEKSAAAGTAADTGVSSELKESSQIIMLKPRSKAQRLAIRLTKVAVGLAAVAAVVIAVILFNLKDVTLNSREPDWAQEEGDKNAVAAANTEPLELALTDETQREYPNSPSPAAANERQITVVEPEQMFPPASSASTYKSESKLIAGVASEGYRDFYLGKRRISFSVGKVENAPGALPDNVDGIKEENNGPGSEAEYDSVRLKLEVPYLKTTDGALVSFSEIRRILVDDREMWIEILSREDAEEGTALIVECKDPSGEKVKLSPGKKVLTDVVYDSENSNVVTWIYEALGSE